MKHELKTWPIYFQPLAKGKKTFEIRRDDRQYKEGDILVLKEWSKDSGYTSNEVVARVEYLLRDDVVVGVPPGYVIMSISIFEVKNGNIHYIFNPTPAPVLEKEPQQ